MNFKYAHSILVEAEVANGWQCIYNCRCTNMVKFTVPEPQLKTLGQEHLRQLKQNNNRKMGKAEAPDLRNGEASIGR
jgi:hypothetical protein